MSPPLRSLPGRNRVYKFKDESRITASEYAGGIEEYGPEVPEVIETEMHQPEAIVPQPLPFAPPVHNPTSSNKWLNLVSIQQGATGDFGKKPNDYALWGSDESTRVSSARSDRLRTLNSASYNGSKVPKLDTPGFALSRKLGHGCQPSDRPAITSAWNQTTLHESDRPDVTVCRYLRSNVKAVFHPRPSLDTHACAKTAILIKVFVQDFGIWRDMIKSGALDTLVSLRIITPTILIKSLLICDIQQLNVTAPFRQEPELISRNMARQLLYYCLEQLDPNSRDRKKQGVNGVLFTVDDAINIPGTSGWVAAGRLARGELQEPADKACPSRRDFCISLPMDVVKYMLCRGPMPDRIQRWNRDAGRIDNSIVYLDGVRQEPWTRAILHLLANVSSFRASIPRLRETDRRAEHVRVMGERRNWDALKRSCDGWNDKCPPTMYPAQYYDRTENGLSVFPKIWMLNRAAVLARLFYHTAQCVLMQAYPIQSNRDFETMHALQLSHAHQVCGIITHYEDKEIAPVAIQSLTTATPILKERTEQAEVLRLLDRIGFQSGLRVKGVKQDLKEAWGWEIYEEELMEPTMLESLVNERGIGPGVVLVHLTREKTPSEASESDTETIY